MVAPDLFNFVVDHLMTCIGRWTTGFQLDSYNLTDLEHADISTMFSNTSTDLEAGHNVFQEEASELGLQVSWEETKLMHVGDSPGPPLITAGTIAVEFVNSFSYLGSPVMNTGNPNEEINWY